MAEDLIPNTPPEDQFYEEVRPSYSAYMLDTGSVWKAKSASYFAGHFAEWVFLYYKDRNPSRVYLDRVRAGRGGGLFLKRRWASTSRVGFTELFDVERWRYGDGATFSLGLRC